VRLRIVLHRGQVLASAEIIAPHALHDVILAMTLPRRPHSFAGSRYGICIDAKWFGDQLQLVGCRKKRPHFAQEKVPVTSWMRSPGATPCAALKTIGGELGLKARISATEVRVV
jgi:hypothetical protein